MRRRRLAALAAAAISSLGSSARPAHAIEGQHHLGLAPTLAMLKVDSKSTLSTGGGGTLHYTYGLTDQFNLTAEGGYAVVAADQGQDSVDTPRDRPSAVGQLSAGASYVIDILQWVPYFGLQVGGYALTGGTLGDPLLLPGASVALGLDYQLSRSWAVGLAGRQHMLLTKLDAYPSYTTVSLRLEYMFGY